MHDQELVEPWPDANAYAEHGTYDMDLGMAGLSRPAPAPYDDPYADDYTDSWAATEPAAETRRSHEPTGSNGNPQRRSGFRSMTRPTRGRGRGNSARNRDTSRSWSGRERGHSVSHDSQGFEQMGQAQKRTHYDEPYDPHHPSSPSTPTAHTTTQSIGPSMYMAGVPMMSPSPFPSSYLPLPDHQHGAIYDSSSYQQLGVQPHINPRFASAFGIGINLLQQQQMHPLSYNAFGSRAGSDSSPGSWSESWTAYGSQQGASEPGPHYPPHR
jgi:H/ACA ribonucleoprotein complex non-core subunit NAF1